LVISMSSHFYVELDFETIKIIIYGKENDLCENYYLEADF
jgi:hypothetical protein